MRFVCVIQATDLLRVLCTLVNVIRLVMDVMVRRRPIVIHVDTIHIFPKVKTLVHVYTTQYTTQELGCVAVYVMKATVIPNALYTLVLAILSVTDVTVL